MSAMTCSWRTAAGPSFLIGVRTGRRGIVARGGRDRLSSFAILGGVPAQTLNSKFTLDQGVEHETALSEALSYMASIRNDLA